MFHLQNHHKGVSPLTQIQIGMVSQIPLPDIIIDGHQFKKMNTGKYILKTNFEDSCVRIQGKFSLVKKIVLSSESEIYIVYQCFQETDTFFYFSFRIKIDRDCKGIQFGGQCANCKTRSSGCKVCCYLTIYK